jgi:hypothetical protein
MAQLTTEILDRIIFQSSTNTVLALSLTSRSLHTVTLPHLYSNICLTTINNAHSFCRTILGSSGTELGSYVLSFNFCHVHRSSLHVTFWEMIRDALVLLVNLRALVLFDHPQTHYQAITRLPTQTQTQPQKTNAWILDAVSSPHLTQCRVRLGWDIHSIHFLNRHPTIQHFQALDTEPPVPIRFSSPNRSSIQYPTSLDNHALPLLHKFDGSIRIANSLLDTDAQSSLTHVQISLDDKIQQQSPSPPQPRIQIIPFLHKLFTPRANLVSLNILDMKESSVIDVLDLLRVECPHLKHLGILPLSATTVMSLSCLPALLTPSSPAPPNNPSSPFSLLSTHALCHPPSSFMGIQHLAI